MFNRVEKNTRKEYLYDLYLQNNAYNPIVTQYAVSNIRRIDGIFELYLKREGNGYRRSTIVDGHIIEVAHSTSTVFKQEGVWKLNTEYTLKVNGEFVSGRKIVNYKGKPVDTTLRIGNLRVAAFISEFTPLVINKYNKKS